MGDQAVLIEQDARPRRRPWRIRDTVVPEVVEVPEVGDDARQGRDHGHQERDGRQEIDVVAESGHGHAP